MTAIIYILPITGVAQSQDFYDIGTISTIEITFSEADWDNILDSLYAAGDEERLTGTAVINGEPFDSVGVRYKGSSSYNPDRIKNPLNIKLDHIIDDQTIDGYGTLKLANVWKDPTFVREVIGYEIARKYMPASRANFIKVYINGTFLGLYTSVQSVDKFFARTHFYSGDYPRFKGVLPDDDLINPVPVWGYLGKDSTEYIAYYELKSDEGWSNLIEFLDIFNNNTNLIEDVLDIDRHLWMLAFDNLIVNLDAPINFGHNFYLFKDGSGQFNPIIWDLNESFGSFSLSLPGGAPLTSAEMQKLSPYFHSNHDDYPIISEALSNPTYEKMYIAHMRTIAEENFAGGWYRNRALEIQALIDSVVQSDTNKFYSYDDFLNNLDNSVYISALTPPTIIGITELMDARLAFLNTLFYFTAVQSDINEISYFPTEPPANSTVQFTAGIINADSVILGYRQNRAERFEKAAMLDDGEHNDGVAEDHVYGVSIDIGAGEIQYYIYAQNEEAGIFSPARAEYEYYTIDVTAPVANMLVINEFMASNDTTIFDQNGEYDDWLEIYNKSDSVVNIGGYFLTDDPAALTQWVFPDTSIASHGHLLVWADDNTEQNGLHAGFKLSASGEAILLVDSNEVIVDEIVFSQQSADLSYGRYPDGTDYLTFFAIPTPGEDNVGYRCGDADGNIQIDILDVTYMIDYLYRNGPSPIMIKSSDANDSGNINLLNIIYLINYLYKGGPTPVC